MDLNTWKYDKMYINDLYISKIVIYQLSFSVFLTIPDRTESTCDIWDMYLEMASSIVRYMYTWYNVQHMQCTLCICITSYNIYTKIIFLMEFRELVDYARLFKSSNNKIEERNFFLLRNSLSDGININNNKYWYIRRAVMAQFLE